MQKFLPLSFIFTQGFTQEINVSLNLADESSSNLEYNTNQTLRCDYTIIQTERELRDVSEQFLNTSLIDTKTDDPVEVEWRLNGETLYTAGPRENYQPYASIGTAAPANLIASAVNPDEKTTSLEVSGVQLNNAGKYSCHVKYVKLLEIDEEVGYMQASGEVDLGVFATPTVEFANFPNTSFDLRTGETEFTLGNCVVAGAYPKPETISLNIDERVVEAAEDNAVADESELINADVEFTVTLAGEDNGKEIFCSANEENYGVQSEKKVLDVLYLPTKTNVVFYNTAGDQVDSIFENEGYTVKCESDGNPAPMLELRTSEVNSTAVENGEATHTEVSRDGGIEYHCVASEAAFNFTMTSESRMIGVQYLDAPKLTADREAADGIIPLSGEEESTTFICDVTSNPEATIAWFQNGEAIEGAVGAAYTLDHTTLGNGEAKFSCAASLAGRTTDSNELSVQIQRPCVIKDLTSVTINGKKTFTCEVDAGTIPSCEIVWNYDKSFWKKATVRQNNLEIKNFLDYDIEDVTKHKVSCRAKNSVGSDSRYMDMPSIAKELKKESKPWYKSTFFVLILIILGAIFAGCCCMRKKQKANENAPKDDVEAGPEETELAKSNA